MELNLDIAKKVLATVDAGLVLGMGESVPGQMCVEAAVCFAYGLPHSDNPPCVGHAVRTNEDWSERCEVVKQRSQNSRHACAVDCAAR